MTRTPMLRLGLEHDEIIVDSFAGGGGASEGIRLALGRDPDIAINHDAEAIALHAANHPGSKHYTENVWKVDPRTATGGRPVGLMWLSPDCRHFSKAKGGKPVLKKVRGLAWIAVRWAVAVKPRVMVLENVEEFQTWGPVLKDGRPCPERKGQTFRAFKRKLERLGYVVEHREMRACDFGAPTIRKRLFLIARCDGQPIIWPEKTHGKGTDKPWRTAAECIDWSLSCPSIFTRKKELAENTLKRIARGLKRFVIESPKPFIVTLTHHGVDRVTHLDDPFKTITAAHRGEQALVVPYTAGVGGRAGQSPERSADQPTATITAKGDTALLVPMIVPIDNKSSGDRGAKSAEDPLGTIVVENRHSIVTPLLVQTAHGERDKTGKKRGKGEHTLEEPMGTVLSTGNHSIVAPVLEEILLAPHITKFRTGSTGSAGDEPMPTVTANSFIKRPGGAAPLGVVGVFLKPRYGEREGQEPRVRSLDQLAQTTVPSGNGGDLVAAVLTEYHSPTTEGGERARSVNEPLPTEDTSNRFGLAAAFLAKHYGDSGQRPGSGLEEPVSTVTACDHNAIVAAHIKRDFGTSTGSAVTEPMGTITADGGGHASLVATSIMQMQGGSTGHPVDQPMNSITAKEKFAEVRAFMVAYYGNEKDGGALIDPMRTVTSKDRLGLVTVHGIEYAIIDIGMRMLAPRELYNAQGFRVDYRIDIPYKGKPLTKTAQVRMAGNSVCPPMAAAIVLANVSLRKAPAKLVKRAA